MIIFKKSEITKQHYFIKQTNNNNNNNNINIKKKSVLTRQEPDTPKSKKKICINQARAEDTPNSYFGVHVSCDLRIFG